MPILFRAFLWSLLEISGWKNLGKKLLIYWPIGFDENELLYIFIYLYILLIPYFVKDLMAKSSSLVANYLYLRGMLRASCGENLEVWTYQKLCSNFLLHFVFVLLNSVTYWFCFRLFPTGNRWFLFGIFEKCPALSKEVSKKKPNQPNLTPVNLSSRS